MRKLITRKLLAAVMLLTLVGLVDECIEGDCQDGFGRGFISDRRVYDGAWLNGEPHRGGKLYNFSTGKVTLVYFEHGELLEEQSVKP